MRWTRILPFPPFHIGEKYFLYEELFEWLLGFSKLYMVTILRRRQEERNTTQLKCYKKTYIYIEREERKYCPCKQLVCGKLIRKRRPFNSLYFLCPFGWVEESRALFLVLQLLEKTSQACMASRSLRERWARLDSEESAKQKRKGVRRKRPHRGLEKI